MCWFAKFDEDGSIHALDSNNLCWAFTCHKSPYKDAYYQEPEDKKNPMWYSINFAQVWVDGGEIVPRIGCKNYDFVY